MACPKCEGGSKGELSFGVTVDENSKSAVWNCFRGTCGYTGSAHVDKPAMVNDAGFFVTPSSRRRKEEAPVRPAADLQPLTSEMVDFFNERGISADTLARNKVSSQVVYDPALKREARVIAFPYYRSVYFVFLPMLL